MNSIKIRKAKLSDLKTIQDLNHELFLHDYVWDKNLDNDWPYKQGKKYFEKKIKGEDSFCYVAEDNSEIIGYLAGCIREIENYRPVKRSELENMYVKDSYRGKGVGGMLTKEFLKWSKSKGVKLALVVADSHNKGAVNFYRKMGFLDVALFLEAKL